MEALAGSRVCDPTSVPRVALTFARAQPQCQAKRALIRTEVQPDQQREGATRPEQLRAHPDPPRTARSALHPWSQNPPIPSSPELHRRQSWPISGITSDERNRTLLGVLRRTARTAGPPPRTGAGRIARSPLSPSPPPASAYPGKEPGIPAPAGCPCQSGRRRHTALPGGVPDRERAISGPWPYRGVAFPGGPSRLPSGRRPLVYGRTRD